MALLAGSPAIDAGSSTYCPATDQRGIAHPQGVKCDIGAFELEQYTISGNTGLGGVTLSYTNGTLITATSGSTGNYSFYVPTSWSGTVTPSLTGYTSRQIIQITPMSPRIKLIKTTQHW